MSTHYIKIFYGPVESFGLNAEFRPQFLYGLRDRLRKLGNRVDIVPVPILNYCLLECCGYMMSTHYIKIFYGPVESFGLNAEFRPQFLYGLRDRLRKLGNRVDIVPVPILNYCLLECCGYMMFRCNIKSLCFNSPYEVDPVCKNALEAVRIGTERLQRARTYIWIWNLIYHQLFKRSEFAAQDYWISDLPPIKEDKELMDCLACCKLDTKVTTPAAQEKFLEQLKQTYRQTTNQERDVIEYDSIRAPKDHAVLGHKHHKK